MKLVPRCFFLGAALLLTALSTARSSTGTCQVLCAFPPGSNPQAVIVVVEMSYDDCCGYVINPCPSGTYPGRRSYDGVRCPNPI